MLGPTLHLASVDELRDIEIKLNISRKGESVFSSETANEPDEATPRGAGELPRARARVSRGCVSDDRHGIVPRAFTLQRGDVIDIRVGAAESSNPIG